MPKVNEQATPAGDIGGYRVGLDKAGEAKGSALVSELRDNTGSQASRTTFPAVTADDVGKHYVINSIEYVAISRPTPGHGRLVTLSELTHANFLGFFRNFQQAQNYAAGQSGGLTAGLFYYSTTYGDFEEYSTAPLGWTGYNPFAGVWASVVISGTTIDIAATAHAIPVHGEAAAERRSSAVGQIYADYNTNRIIIVSAFTAEAAAFENYEVEVYRAPGIDSLTDTDRHRLDLLGDVIEKTADLHVERTRTWATATDAAFALFAAAPSDTDIDEVADDEWFVSYNYSNTNTAANYPTIRIPLDEDIRNYRIRERDNASPNYIKLFGAGDFRELYSDATYRYFGHQIYPRSFSVATLEKDSVTSETTHYRGETDADDVEYDPSGKTNIPDTATDVDSALGALDSAIAAASSGGREILYDNLATLGFNVASNSSAWNVVERVELSRALTLADDGKDIRVFGSYQTSGFPKYIDFELDAELFRRMSAIDGTGGSENSITFQIQRPNATSNPTGAPLLSGFAEANMHFARYRAANGNDGIWLNVGSNDALQPIGALKMKVILVGGVTASPSARGYFWLNGQTERHPDGTSFPFTASPNTAGDITLTYKGADPDEGFDDGAIVYEGTVGTLGTLVRQGITLPAGRHDITAMIEINQAVTDWNLALWKEQTGTDDRFLGASEGTDSTVTASVGAAAIVKVTDVIADGTEKFYFKIAGIENVNVSFALRGFVLIERRG